MQTMETGSTHKSLDDLNSRMSEGFQRGHREIDDLSKRMSEGFQRVDGDIKELRRETNERFATVETRFDAMHRTMMRGFFAIGGITVTLFLALAGLQGF
jgi:uncharacterized protein Yka (UPF0111/DUF47 family)